MSPRVHSESARQRELYKYWQPNESVFPSAQYDESFNTDYTPRPSYDSALTAYAQLGALRCNAKRGMISVVDQHSQYIIAEGTKTLSLQDGSVTDHNDQLWFGLRTIPRQMGICAMALGQFTTTPGHEELMQNAPFAPLQFVIPDLSKDPRFENQVFVCGVPYLRFYAGVPIYSPAGYIIGIYSIVDDKPRENFGERDLNILKDLAATVMDHLVLGTIRSRHHRAERMVKGLGLFVEGKSTLRNWWLRSGRLAHGPTTKDGSKGEWTLKAQAEAEFGPEETEMIESRRHDLVQAREGDDRGGFENDVAPKSTSSFSGMTDAPSGEIPTCAQTNTSGCALQGGAQGSLSGLMQGSTIGSVPSRVGVSPPQDPVPLESTKPVDHEENTEPDAQPLSTSQGIKAMLSRASSLIRESIEVEGCLFLGSSAMAFKDNWVRSAAKTRDTSISQPEAPYESKSDDGSTVSDCIEEKAGQELKHNYFGDSTTSTCELLGCSLKFDSDVNPSKMKDKFRFSHDFLSRLLKRYPNGVILNFESDGKVSSSENGVESSLNGDHLSKENRRARKKETSRSLRELDEQTIRDVFPGIRCLAFFPLREPSTNSWLCGLFAWTNDPMRVLDPVDDLAYLAAFGNSIMAEKSRFDAVLADQMKNNFMSTVSHELRSPLHGILAGAELLKDLSTTVAQSDLINMINVCGRTLLDTVNHILDFTELNRSRKPKTFIDKSEGDGQISSHTSVLPRSPIKQVVNIDLSKLIEEAMDSTLVDYDFERSGAAATTSLDSQGHAPEFNKSSQGPGTLVHSPTRIRVILDVEARSSWVFASTPGAWRRILMNLFGNSLKYTKDGYIHVSLRNMPGKYGQPSVILSVKDTGEGISPQFLKHHAFHPFMQEDSLATGTGLGLSIVQRIVHDMNGEITIKSEKGAGTQVDVQISLAQPSSSSDKPSSDKDDDNIERIRAKMKSMKVCIVSSRCMLEGDKITSPGHRTSVADPSIVSLEAAQRLEGALVTTLTHWFGLEITKSSSMLDEKLDGKADLYLLLGDDFEGSVGSQATSGAPSYHNNLTDLVIKNKVIVLGTSASAARTGAEFWKLPHFIQQPFGPHKLARAFEAFLSAAKIATQEEVTGLRAKPLSTTLASQPLGIAKSPLTSFPNHPKPKEIDLMTNEKMFTLHPTINPILRPIHTNRVQDPILLLRSQVLLVEDNEINLKLLVMYMRKLKFLYRTAVNGLEALQLYKEHHATLRVVITDISMPIMDGMVSTLEMRRFEKEKGIAPATIVALTGVSSIGAREKVVASGVDKFFAKPMPLATVKELLLQAGCGRDA
ncbi:hypothetical protein VTL71DRAFT_13290 [Oculimacula yallundae]|uniref:histidine kinase n=1 Tax=Oculimacula yallundae TaxID=86028 RepID=A0ABR4CM80_9HELO